MRRRPVLVASTQSRRLRRGRLRQRNLPRPIPRGDRAPSRLLRSQAGRHLAHDRLKVCTTKSWQGQYPVGDAKSAGWLLAFPCRFDQGRRPRGEVPKREISRLGSQISGCEGALREIRSQMSRLRCTAKAQHLVFLASIFGCGRRPRRAPLDMTDDARFPQNPGEAPMEPHALNRYFLSCAPLNRRYGLPFGAGRFTMAAGS